MIRILQWLFLGHVHRWKTLSTHNLKSIDGNGYIGVAYIQKCEHCGVVKRRDLQ